MVSQVVRQVLHEAIAFEGDEDDQDAWQHHALKLASASSGALPRPDDEDQVDEWVDEVVRKFAQRHRLWRGISEFLSEEGEE